MIRNLLEIAPKSLIFHGFKGDPKKLWITLLKTTLGQCAGLENQAIRWIAHQLSKKLNTN